MEPAVLRTLLNEARSSGKPMGCAVGLSKDAKTGLLQLHKTHQGQELGRALKKEVPDIVNLRFGTATIVDPKTMRLVLDRPVSGLANKLLKTALKGTFVKKLKLGLPDGTDFDGAADEEPGQDTAGKTQGSEGTQETESRETQGDETAGLSGSGDVTAEPPPPPPPPPEQTAPDAAALKKELAELAGKIAAVTGGDAAKSAPLVKLAREAQVNLGTNNLNYAAISIAQLRRAIEAAGEGGTASSSIPPPPPPPPETGVKPDAGALKSQLEALAKRIPGAAAGDAARQAALVKLARDAQVNLATNNLTYAAASIAQLRQAIEGADKGSDGKPDTQQSDAGETTSTPPVDAEKTLAFLRRLKLLIGKAANGDAALEAEWMALADGAEGQLSGGNPAAGAAAVEKLRLAMLPAVTRLQEEAKTAGAYTSSGKKWLDMRQTVEDEMEKLRLAIAGAYENDPALPAIEQAFRAKTAPVLRNFDASLAVKLEAAGKAAQAEERQKLLDEAHGIIDGYRAYAADPLLADLDDNPFVPLSLQSSLNATLAELAAAIH